MSNGNGIAGVLLGTRLSGPKGFRLGPRNSGLGPLVFPLGPRNSGRGTRFYCTAMVTVLLVCPPAEITKATLAPVGAFIGTVALICQSPTKPGARPLNWTGAFTPPMVTVGCTCVSTSEPLVGAAWPAASKGLVTPAPVAKIWITLPRAAGFVAKFCVLSSFSTAACPLPLDERLKIPGNAVTTEFMPTSVVPFALVNWKPTELPLTKSDGTWKFIWFDPTNKSGTLPTEEKDQVPVVFENVTLPACNETPANEVGSGIAVAEVFWLAPSLANRVASEPGATVPFARFPFWNDAAFTIDKAPGGLGCC